MMGGLMDGFRLLLCAGVYLLALLAFDGVTEHSFTHALLLGGVMAVCGAIRDTASLTCDEGIGRGL